MAYIAGMRSRALHIACVLACSSATACVTVLDIREYPPADKPAGAPPEVSDQEAANVAASMVEYPNRSADPQGILAELSGAWLTLDAAKSRCAHKSACRGFTIALPGGITDAQGKLADKYDGSTNSGEATFYGQLVDRPFAGFEAGFTLWVAPQRFAASFVGYPNSNAGDQTLLVPGMPAGQMHTLDAAKLRCAQHPVCRGFNFGDLKTGYTSPQGMHYPDNVNAATGESKVWFFAPIVAVPIKAPEAGVTVWTKPQQF